MAADNEFEKKKSSLPMENAAFYNVIWLFAAGTLSKISNWSP